MILKRCFQTNAIFFKREIQLLKNPILPKKSLNEKLSAVSRSISNKIERPAFFNNYNSMYKKIKSHNILWILNRAQSRQEKEEME